ncbi:MAG: hypothetical protein JJU02_16120, partial [Cryomorphaceae bacterium]|nr:hypothetical protein [Cryomorphaceae bacterium]
MQVHEGGSRSQLWYDDLEHGEYGEWETKDLGELTPGGEGMEVFDPESNGPWVRKTIDGLDVNCAYRICFGVYREEMSGEFNVHLYGSSGTIEYEVIEGNEIEDCFTFSGVDKVTLEFAKEAGTTFYINYVSLEHNCPGMYYTADVIKVTDYYPFGWGMPGRRYNQGDYRYGFNTQEKVDEVKGSG